MPELKDKKELEFLLSLLRSVKSDYSSSRAVGVKIPEREEKMVNKLEQKFEKFVACI